MKIRILLIILSLNFSCFIFSQTKEEVEKITRNYDLKKIKELKVTLKSKEAVEKKEAYEAAERNGWPITIQKEDGTFQELMKLTPDGFPVYYSTHNVAAAASTRTNYLNTGGGLGLALDGQNMVARVWDGGTIRRSHSGFSNRVQTVDDPSGVTFIQHATHVTGTILAAPWNSGSANIKGMAPQATARTFNWTDDETEALSEVALGMLVSNHSYGVPLTNTSNGVSLPSWYIGSYIEDSRAWDQITYLSPYYLPVFSAGNDGNNPNNTDPIVPGFDKLIGNKVSKNVLTVANAQDAVIASDGSLSSVEINSSSSQGPTDDRRIKPDITGNGTEVLSLNSTGDTTTYPSTGTSMAAPNVTGTLLLLQQHYKNVSNNYMLSATLKGLACHTADDAGEVGPDPVFGWGLLNAKKAVETINNNGLSSWISEEKLNQGQTYTMTVKSNGGSNNPLIASITWTDVPGEANNGQRLTPNDNFRSLINDLDIRITRNGTTYYPWRLDNDSPTSLALNNGDNNVDNVEQIRIDSPAAGDYVITITHKGNLVNGSQNYSLVVTGIGSSIAIVPTSDNLVLCSNQNASYTFAYKQTGSGTTNFSATNLPAGVNVSFSPSSLSTNGNVTMTISNLTNAIPGDYTVGIVGNNGTEIETRNRALRIYSATFSPIVLSSPTNAFNGTSTTVNLDWQNNVNAESYKIQVSTSPNFTIFIVNQDIADSNFIVSNLAQDKIYYWRVIPSNRCGTAIANAATVYYFRTGILSCGSTFTATNFSNATIATTANASASVPVVVTGGLTIGEMRVNVGITHSFIQDMTITLQGPASIGSPVLVLLDKPCGNNDNISCRFIDTGSYPACSGNPAISGDILSNDPLSNLNGLVADGTWTLLVKDPYNNDGGAITSFSIELCNVIASLSSGENILNSLKVYPNPTKGIVNIDLATNEPGETTYELFDVQGRKVISKVSSNNFETLNVENLSDGIYMLIIENGSAKTTKKLVLSR